MGRLTMRGLMLGLLLFGLVAPWAAAQVPPESVAEVRETLSSFEPVPVPEPSELAVQRYRTGNWLWLFNQFWALLVPFVILVTGFSARIRNVAVRIGRWWYFVIVVYFTAYMLITYAVDWPLSFYQGYIREHAYGLSNQTFGKWQGDSLKMLMVNIVLGAMFLWVPYLLLKKSPKRWWLYTGLLVPVFLCFQTLIAPVFIAPLFNEFGPMKDQELEAKILALAERSGIEGSRVYEVEKSVDTNAVNAYVTGFMDTKRIVLWDTLLEKLDEDEVLFVMAHEMGHFVLNHIVKFIMFVSIIIFVALYLVHRVANWVLARHGDRFGFHELGDIASFPLILLLMGVLSLLVTPMLMGLSRHNEREADQFGIELTQDSRAAATAFVTLQQENLGVPWHHPVLRYWRGSHPSIAERITFFNEYRPWETGEPMAFDHLFEPEADD